MELTHARKRSTSLWKKKHVRMQAVPILKYSAINCRTIEQLIKTGDSNVIDWVMF